MGKSSKVPLAALLATAALLAGIFFYILARKPAADATGEDSGNFSTRTNGPDATAVQSVVTPAHPASAPVSGARAPDPRLTAFVEPSSAALGPRPEAGAPPGANLPPRVPSPVAAAHTAANVAAAKRDRDAVSGDLDKVTLMLRDFRTVMGENPVGTNAEIMKAIMGGNPKGARLGPPENQAMNGQGELIDQWGTPIFFHQLSKNNMEIRSAGPDRELFTEDDVVAH